MAIRGPGLSSSLPTSLEGAAPSGPACSSWSLSSRTKQGGGRAASPGKEMGPVNQPPLSCQRRGAQPQQLGGDTCGQCPLGGWVVRRREACWVGSQQSATIDFINQSCVNCARGGSRSHLRDCVAEEVELSRQREEAPCCPWGQPAVPPEGQSSGLWASVSSPGKQGGEGHGDLISEVHLCHLKHISYSFL